MIYRGCLAMAAGVCVAAVFIGTFWLWLLQGLSLCLIRVGWWAVVVFNVGVGYYLWSAHQLTAWQLPVSQIKTPITLIGRVISIPKVTQHVEQFDFKDQQHHKYRLSWYQPYQLLHEGDVWRLTVSIKPPSGLYNPGGFDYRRWLVLHNFKGTGYVKNHASQQLLKASTAWSVMNSREKLATLILQHIKQQPIAALLVALTIGSHQWVQADQWQVLQRTGTNHLIAIAGLHFGFVLLFVYGLSGWLWSRSTRLLLWWPRPYFQAAVSLVVMPCYALLAGFSLPTQRALIMAMVLVLTVLWRRPIPLWQRLLFAFCVIVLISPFDLLGMSLWLSFAAVFFIIYINHGKSGLSHWRRWWRLQLALVVGLAPLTLYFFHQLSLIGLFANAVAVPWVGFIILPCCLLATVLTVINTHWAIALYQGASCLLKPLWIYLSWLASWKWGNWQHDITQLWVLIVALMGAVILLWPGRNRWRGMGLLCVLPIIFFHPVGPRPHQLWVTVLDVGQGLAVVVRTPHHTLLYDAGPKSYSGFDAGSEVVVPYLRYFDIHRLDQMMISHGDNDHIGGASSVLQALPVRNIVTSVVQRFQNSAEACYAGQHWQWDGVQFRVLWPPQDKPYQDNNSSCVLQIINGSQRVLLTGDVESEVEHQLVERYGKQLRSTLLIVPHHGSRTSSTLGFVSCVNPAVAIFSTGFYNRFHFPAESVWRRYAQVGSKLYNTAVDGAVSVYFNNNKILNIKVAIPQKML